MTRAGLYARVSREEQAAGYSIDTQLNSMRSYAQERGWDVIEYTEPGHTARTDERPVFQELMADASAGRLDVVMVHRLDRGFRNLEDQLRDLRCLRELGVAFVSVQEGFDDSSSHARLIQNVKGSINQYYSDLLSEKTRDGKRARARDGKSNASQPPYGYQRNAEGKDIIDQEAAKAVLLAFKEYATGEQSDMDVANILNRAGYPPSGRARSGRWTREGIRYMLTNPFYVGNVQHGDNLYPGEHEPLVDRELWDAVQALRTKRNQSKGGRRRSDRVYLLSGLAVCAHCGLTLVSQTSTRPGRRDIAQYYCPSKRRAMPCKARPRLTRADVVDEQVGELIKRLWLPDDWRQRLEELSQHREEQDQIEGQRRYLQSKLRRLRDLYLEGDYAKGEYQRLKATLQAELDALQEPETPEVEQAGATLEALADAWQGADVRLRAEMLRTIFQEIVIDVANRQLVCVRPHRPFAILLRMNGLEERNGCFYPRRRTKEA
jgi:site-specific DNA recombinase